ncbi:MAG: hypothetical protein AAF798_19435 [Bacteroidota bacterium]
MKASEFSDLMEAIIATDYIDIDQAIEEVVYFLSMVIVKDGREGRKLKTINDLVVLRSIIRQYYKEYKLRQERANKARLDSAKLIGFDSLSFLKGDCCLN